MITVRARCLSLSGVPLHKMVLLFEKAEVSSVTQTGQPCFASFAGCVYGLGLDLG